MKLSNEKILNTINNSESLLKKQLPVKVSYAITKNITKLETEIKAYSKEREKLIEKYSDGEGIKPEYAKAWGKDIRELLEIEIEIEIHKFKLEALEGYDISPAEIMLIEYMVEE